MSFFKKFFTPEKKEDLDKGLEKTKEGFFNKLGRAVAGKDRVDEEVLDELENVLISSDVGLDTTIKIIERIEARVAQDRYLNTRELNHILRDEIVNLLAEQNNEDFDDYVLPTTERPAIILVVGVNGVGKTTTIGKLANQFQQRGHKVVLGAADTFRAAAVDQLGIWAQRVGCEFYSKGMNTDPAAVAYETVQYAKKNDCSVAIIDTAGRLHTKFNLMKELSKIKRSVTKAMPGAPHQVLLVLDATTGQNALSQVKTFQQLANVTGLVMTKLDGTAKGGVLVALADKFGLPIHAIGVGEQIDDLAPFDPEEFARALTGADS